MTDFFCPEHGPPADPEDRFCEVCGRNLRTGEAAAQTAPPLPAPRPSTPAPLPWLSSRAGDGACAGCGARVPAGGYCDDCGRRRAMGSEHAELELPAEPTGGPAAGAIAAVTDKARRPRNEDAVAIGRHGDTTVAIVCDGVSTSTRADTASHAAVEAGMHALLGALADGADAAEASRRGARAASSAARGTGRPEDGDSPPSCTYVSAVVTGEEVTVGWVGDSRAYWLGPQERCLTVDDSLAGRLAAGMAVPPGLADADPRSRALIRWLGVDADGEDPQVVTVRPAGPGPVVVCSDGLHYYLPEAADMAKAAAALGPAPLTVAQGLLRYALDAGGHDNIAVAVLPFPPNEIGVQP
ncbi:PP2C family protein-serine/threonine phosphatase [Rhizomonospora bruguierae]|uniref:PP2C family protein-serine/threonine phosphatase n=1 Tax=Rhizomonospora bruguierae TaxID=1581705 RepID=UPI001BD11992|nr:protein phosphatase 2C domain-containing protein [Micromonospora sp. NBRC 107566]